MMYNNITVSGKILNNHQIAVPRGNKEDIVFVNNLDKDSGYVLIKGNIITTQIDGRKQHCVLVREAHYQDNDFTFCANRFDIVATICKVEDLVTTKESKQFRNIIVVLKDESDIDYYLNCIVFYPDAPLYVGDKVSISGKLMSRTYTKHHAEYVDIGGYSEVEEWDEEVLVSVLNIEYMQQMGESAC